ncbi:MAG: caspase family protein [Ferruginibacter sp.]
MKTAINLLRYLFTVALFFNFHYGYGQQEKPRLLVPFGHQYGIERTIFSHDNKFIVTSDEALTIISDVRSGKPLYYLNGVRPSISADDNYIATSQDSFVLIWNVAGGKLLRALELPHNIEAKQTRFHSTKNLLIVEESEISIGKATGMGNAGGAGSKPDPDRRLSNVSLWDFISGTKQHDFFSNKEGEDNKANCKACVETVCNIYASWFNQQGDSIRIIYTNLIKTFAIGNYDKPSYACMESPDKKANEKIDPSVKILDGRNIENHSEETTYCYNEFGNYVGSWSRPVKIEVDGMKELEFESISPVYNYQVTYSSKMITLRNLLAKTEKYYEVDGVRRISFNKAGTLMLIEYISESPRIFKTEDVSEPTSIPEKDYEGFPVYIYATRTSTEGNEMAAVFDRMDVAMPAPNVPKPLKRFIPKMPNPMHNMINSMKDDTKNAFTNSGEIINLYNRRTISKIQSLIKLTGDIGFSPDKKIMLLNSGKTIAAYSIPYARILVTLKPSMYGHTIFSPNSKWLVQLTNDSGKVIIINLVNDSIKNYRIPYEKGTLLVLSFSSDSKTVTISNNKGDCSMINVENTALSKERKTIGGYFPSEDGSKYAFVNASDGSVHVYTQKDSAEIFTTKKAYLETGKKEEQVEPGKVRFNYRVGFARNTNSLIVWDAMRIVYIKDIANPKDTQRLTNMSTENHYTKATLSPNGIYINLQLYAGNCVIYNTVNKNNSLYKGLVPGANGLGLLQSMGKMFRTLLSGNNEMFNKEIAQFNDSGDSVFICYNDSASIYSCADGRLLNAFKTKGDIRYFNLKNNLLISCYYGELFFYRINDKQQWFSMIPFTNGETVFMLPNDVFFGSKSATRNLGYIYGDKSLSYKQFDFNSNRPDTVLRALGNTDNKFLGIYDSVLSIRKRREGIKNMNSMNFNNAPEVVILNDKEINGEVKQKEISLKLRMKGNNQYPDRLAVFINGNPMYGEKGMKLLHKAYTMDTTIKLNLTEGKNIVEASVFDVTGVESYRQPVYIQYSPDTRIKKNVYFIGIGAAKYSNSGKNLNWAKNDITGVLDFLNVQFPGRVIIDTLFNNQVTVENIRKLRARLARSQPDDIVIAYYSGHGEIDIDKAEAFFGTYDMDFNDPSKRGISIKDFNDIMENIPSRNKAVFLDACHSGEINKMAWKQNKPVKDNEQKKNELPSATSDADLDKGEAVEMRNPGETDPFDLVLELFTDLYQGNGTNIIVAARGLEAAKECEKIKHGVFTYCVLDGVVQAKADFDSNAVVTIGEVQNYIIRNVPVFSGFCEAAKIQRAAARKENEFNDWAVVDNDSVTIRKKSIVKQMSTEEKKSFIDKHKIERDSYMEMLPPEVLAAKKKIDDTKKQIDEKKEKIEKVKKTLDKFGFPKIPRP